MPRSRTRHFLRLSTTDAILYSVMVGCGEAYIGAFGLAIGLTEVQVGLLGSVPLLMGAIFQLLSPRFIRQLDSHKKWVILCTLLQAAAFIPLIAMAIIGRGSAPLVFLAAGAYWGANLATGPAWNTWIGTVVPRAVRSRYFAGRSRLAQFGVVAGLVSTGLLLRAQSEEHKAAIFIVPFGIAMGARFACTWFHAAIEEKRPIPKPDTKAPIRELIFGKSSASGGRLLLYMLLVQATCNISGPFFTPFMLGELKMSYGLFTVILVSSYTGRIIALPFWGRFAKRFGERALLWVSGLSIIPMSAVWAFTHDPAALIALQVCAGIAWGGYELATFLMLFETIPATQRTGLLTLYNLLNACCVVIGAMIGAVMLSHFGGSTHAYHIIFVGSTIARFITLPFLARVHIPKIDFRNFTFRPVSVRPNTGGQDRPILPSLDDSTK